MGNGWKPLEDYCYYSFARQSKQSEYFGIRNIRKMADFNSSNGLVINSPGFWTFRIIISSTEDTISQWPQFFQTVLKVCPLEKKRIPRVNELLQIIGSDQSDGMLFVYYCIIIFM